LGVGQRDELPRCGKTFSKKDSGIIEDVAFQNMPKNVPSVHFQGPNES